MNILGGYDIEDFAVGMNATFSKTITDGRHYLVCWRIRR